MGEREKERGYVVRSTTCGLGMELPVMVGMLGVAYLSLDLGLSSLYNLGGENAMECSIYYFLPATSITFQTLPYLVKPSGISMLFWNIP